MLLGRYRPPLLFCLFSNSQHIMSFIIVFRYLTTFRYVHLRAQPNSDRTEIMKKKFLWPKSFPNCTPNLRTHKLFLTYHDSYSYSRTFFLGKAIERWLAHHFPRKYRAKCFVLIGPTGTGKTSFALSLPGRVNHFKGRWNLDTWSDYARYSVYDDIPWDDFQKRNYPNKKELLTQNGYTNVCLSNFIAFYSHIQLHV